MLIVRAVRWLGHHVVETIVAAILTALGVFLLRKLPKKLGENAVISWMDDRLGELLGISAPSLLTVTDFAWNYCAPPIFAVLILWAYHLYNNGAYRTTTGKKQLLGLALIAFGVIALISGASLLAAPPDKSAVNADNPATKASDGPADSMLSGRKVTGLEVVQRLERVEKDLLNKGSELAATKLELEATKKDLATALNPVQSPPPPPDRNIAELTSNEKKALVLALNSDVRPIAQSVFISRSTVAPYSHDMSVMSNIFEGAGIRAATGVQSPDGPSQTGLMIGLVDMNAPPLAAKKIKELFAKYGISSTYYLLGEGNHNMGGFNIFIGSKAW